MKITSDLHDDHVLLTISGILSIDNLRIFEKTLNEYYEKKKNIIIDLLNVNYIDSSSLGIIILYLTRLEKVNLHVILINVREDILDLFNMSGVTKLIKLFKDYAEAVKYIRESRKP